MPVLKGEVGGLPVLVSLHGAKLPEAARVERTIPPSTVPSEPKAVASTTRPLVPDPRNTRPAVSGEKPITNSIGMKLVLIPAGEFLMGSPDSDKDA